jgi:hypothetical protein
LKEADSGGIVWGVEPDEQGATLARFLQYFKRCAQERSKADSPQSPPAIQQSFTPSFHPFTFTP